MGILYGMVARGQTVLAEFSCPAATAATTNAGAVARQILEKLPSGNADSNASFSQGRHIFHVKRTDGLTVLCMADDAFESEFFSPSCLISTHALPPLLNPKLHVCVYDDFVIKATHPSRKGPLKQPKN